VSVVAAYFIHAPIHVLMMHVTGRHRTLLLWDKVHRLHKRALSMERGAVVFRDIKQYPGAILVPHICVVKVDAPIYFANVDYIGDRINKYIERYNADKAVGPVHYLVLDLTPVSFIDTTGVACYPVHYDALCPSGTDSILL
jgi:sulfate transporter 4